MTNKQSSILNNDFYIFILILLLIIMLFMLSPKDKESFNINVSKIKLNKKEPFQTKEVKTPTNTIKNFSAEIGIDGDVPKLYLTLNKDIVEDTYILKNDIIKLYDTDNEEDLYYFNILNVKYNPEYNYILEVDFFTPKELNKKTNLNSVKVIGNKYENCVLSSSIIFIKHIKSEEGDYELVFNEIDGEGKLLIDPDEKEKIMNNFQEEEVIEIHHLNKDKKMSLLGLFFIKKKESSKLILTNQDDNLEISKGDQILIKKFDLNEIIKEYYKDKKQYNENYLVTKNKIKNIGLLVDNIKETMNVKI